MEKGHVFYTGPNAQYAALQFAIENNMQTIDMTSLGGETWEWLRKAKKSRAEAGWIDDNKFWEEIGRPAWESASRMFAFSTPTTQKDVYVFIERNYYKKEKKFKIGTAGILHSVEHPALKMMGKKIHVCFV